MTLSGQFPFLNLNPNPNLNPLRAEGERLRLGLRLRIGRTRKLLCLFLLTPLFAMTALGGSLALHTQANEMVELTLASAPSYSDPFNQVELDVVFLDPTGHEFRVPAFCDGGNTWNAR